MTVLVSLALWPVAHTGWLYPAVALILGVALVWQSGSAARSSDGVA